MLAHDQRNLNVFVNGVEYSGGNGFAGGLSRGLLYGHTVFETIPVCDGQLPLRERHLTRLQQSCQQLGLPLDLERLTAELEEASQQFDRQILRITISMDEGGRGYAAPAKPTASRILSFHPLPQYEQSCWQQGVRLGLVDFRLAKQPELAGIKHGNRLEQLIARQQWLTDWQEALVRDQSGYVIEGTQSNVFFLKNDILYTPKIDLCGVNGVMRAWVIAHAIDSGFPMQCVRPSVADIESADAVFLTNSVIGVWPVALFEAERGRIFRYKNQPFIQQLQRQIKEDGLIPYN